MLLAGIDLRLLGSRDLTYRRLGVLLQHSRPGSAFLRSLVGEAAEWTLTDHLLAAVLDMVGVLDWRLRGCKGPAPKTTPRPGTKTEPKAFAATLMPLSEARAREERRQQILREEAERCQEQA